MSSSVGITGTGQIGEVGSAWTVEEDATPIAVDDTFGGVGLATLTSVAYSADGIHQDTRFIANNVGTFTHDTVGEMPGQAALGTVTGIIGNVQTKGHGASFGITPLWGLLNGVTVTAPPMGPAPLSTIIAAYVALATTQVTVSYTATSNPTRIYPGWTGELWSTLKMLAAVNQVEFALIGTQIIVRNIGSYVIQLADEQACELTVPALGTAQIIPIVVQNTSAVTTLLSVIHNYAPNPSVEVSAAGIAATVSKGTLTSSGRVLATSVASSMVAPNGTYVYSAKNTCLVTTGIVRDQASVTVSETFTVPSIEPFYISASVNAYLSTGVSGVGETGLSSFPANGSAPTFTPSVTWLNSTGGVLRTDTGATVNGTGLYYATSSSTGVPTVGFQTIQVGALTPPAGAVTGTLNITAAWNYFPTTSTAGVLELNVDEFMVSEANASYFDGNTSGASWSGTSGLSTSSMPPTGNASFYSAFADNNTVYSVDTGGISVTTIQTDNYPTALAQPTQSSTFPVPTGEYYVCASGDVVIPAGLWAAGGGSVSVAIGTVPGTIILTLTGPAEDIAGAPGPYYLQSSDGTGIAQLSIAGAGVLTNPQTLNLQTGADPTQTPNVTASTIDCPFITDLPTAYAAGIWSASNANNGVQSIQGTIPTAALAGFGLNAGALVTWQGCTYRVATVTIGRTNTTFTANWYQQTGPVTTAMNGRTAAQRKALWGALGYTAADYKIEPLRTS